VDTISRFARMYRRICGKSLARSLRERKRKRDFSLGKHRKHQDADKEAEKMPHHREGSQAHITSVERSSYAQRILDFQIEENKMPIDRRDVLIPQRVTKFREHFASVQCIGYF